MDKLIAVLSGLGIFLFGMLYLESALKEFAGRKLKDYIKRYTSTNLKAIALGAVSTAVLQSSSVITLIVLSFVGAGLMGLGAGIGAIFGANIGTTATAWIVALVGFKIKIGAYAIAITGLGGLLAVFGGKRKNILFIAQMMIGFGLIFFGLSEIKNSMATIADGVDLNFESNYKGIIFLFMGMGLTAVIQSSSAATAIIFSAFYAGIATFELSCAFIIGANLGTTATALLGSIGGTMDKKRIAIAHVLFNVVGSVFVYIFISQYAYFILEILNFKDDPILGLSIFHTLFNLTGVVLFYPFIDLLTQRLNTFFIKKRVFIAQSIHNTGFEIPEASIEAIKKDINLLLDKAMKLSLAILNINEVKVVTQKQKVKEVVNLDDKLMEIDFVRRYKDLKKLEIEILEYTNQVSTMKLEVEEIKAINNLTSAIRRIVYAAKLVKDIRHNIEELIENESDFIRGIFLEQRRNTARFFKNYAYIMEGIKNKGERAQKQYYKMKDSNKEFMENIATLVRGDYVTEHDATTIINVNSSLYHSAKAFLDSADYMYKMQKSEEIKEKELEK
ncbi:Na/Pi cotransporter family protein [Sulfurospirillum arcachonense]|uniref:Na/Pi cotransporter family protein n=1 Tax=Sulfurospirillum arcachonense TaxID=57666 RepID=UPI00046AE7B2|nr:Na/Pi symporter [Sulfurospirillum arcachonense]